MLSLICKGDHKDRRGDINDSHLRSLGSLHHRINYHDNLLCLFDVSNETTSYKSRPLVFFILIDNGVKMTSKRRSLLSLLFVINLISERFSCS